MPSPSCLAAVAEAPRSFLNLAWSAFRARLAFDSLLRSYQFDEQQAYDVLLLLGCPLDLADAAWTQWAIPHAVKRDRSWLPIDAGRQVTLSEIL